MMLSPFPQRRIRRRSSWPRNLRRFSFRPLRGLLFVLVAVCLLFMVHSCRDSLAQKYSPTVYPSSSAEREHWEIDRSSDKVSQSNPPVYSREDLLSARSDWKVLGSGFEGQVFSWQDMAVKVFRSRNAVFRNCVPGAVPELRWPAEISSSLVLGGTAAGWATAQNASYLPVVDYFQAAPAAGREPEWHLVTPLLKLGGLDKLSRRIRESETSYSARELDIIFRPSLDRLLEALDELHNSQGLCHDDIKLDNIFLRGSVSATDPINLDRMTNWVLGDLGNVRHLHHPYHQSYLWSGWNSNLADCRANDVLRLLKSYLIFLRSSIDNVADFDSQFIEGCPPWSRLFLRTRELAQTMETRLAWKVGRLSDSECQPVEESSNKAGTSATSRVSRALWKSLSLMEGGQADSSLVLEALKIGAAESGARFWGLTSILGVPTGECGNVQ